MDLKSLDWNLYLWWRQGKGRYVTCWRVCWLKRKRLMGVLFLGWLKICCKHMNNSGACVLWRDFLYYILSYQEVHDTVLPENHLLMILRQDKLLVHEVVIIWRRYYFCFHLENWVGEFVLLCIVHQLNQSLILWDTKHFCPLPVDRLWRLRNLF